MENRIFTTLLDRFLSGESAPEEEARLKSSLDAEDAETAFDSYAGEKWNAAGSGMPENQKKRIWRRIEMQTVSRPRHRGRIWGAVAAVASVAAAAFCGYLIGHRMEPAVNTFEIIAMNGQKSHVSLPDGTTVMLNSGSSIRYGSDYNTANRSIELDGEAYFEVAKNPELPFVVSAQQLKVEALGTKFNVRAYGTEKEIVTTLVEGRVKASSPHGDVIMNPMEEVAFDKESEAMRKYDAPNRKHLIPWRDNEILFDDDTLEEIAARMERMYNVRILFDDEGIREYSYTGLVRNSSLDNVLNLITATSPVEAKVHSDTIRFSRKR